MLGQFLRRPPLGLRNVIHGRSRSVAAIGGIAFALVMMLMQLGFLEAVKVTAKVNYDQLDFDVILVSPQFEQFYNPGAFPRRRLKEAEGLDTVIAARPLYIRMNMWRCPAYPPGGRETLAQSGEESSAIARWWLGDKRPRPLQRRALLVVGVDLDDNPFLEPIRGQIAAAHDRLRLPGRVLLNIWSNPDFGWALRDQFQGWELGSSKVELVGGFTLLRSFGADAAVLCSVESFARSFGRTGMSDLVNLGLLQVRPGTATETARRLNERLPPDVRAMTRAALDRMEQDYWVGQTATGLIFVFGVAVTMVVAAVVLYQVLSNDIRGNLREYATLQAIGYTSSALGRIVLTQGLVYALVAYVPAVLIAAAAYRLTAELAGIPMILTGANLALVFALDVFFCLAAGLLSLRRLRKADPASLM
jgi:putative ABC transport system permease protein